MPATYTPMTRETPGGHFQAVVKVTRDWGSYSYVSKEAYDTKAEALGIAVNVLKNQFGSAAVQSWQVRPKKLQGTRNHLH